MTAFARRNAVGLGLRCAVLPLATRTRSSLARVRLLELDADKTFSVSHDADVRGVFLLDVAI